MTTPTLKLAEKEYCAAVMQAYMGVWHEAGAAKPDGVSLAPLALDPHGHNGKVGRLVNRVARNRVAYTREELLAYYSSREKAQSKWDNAAPPGLGLRNALTHSDAILKDMRRWYEERLDGEDVSVAWKHLQQCLFKTVTVPLDADIWRNPNLGAAQPEDESEGQVMVVSKEHVARQVREVIAWREKWLAQVGLPMNTLMNNEQKDAFLTASKEEYHNRPDQRERQDQDAASGKISNT